MASSAPAAAPVPQSYQAFALDCYFNSGLPATKLNSLLVAPSLSNGIVSPWPSGQKGVPAWRSDWRVAEPGSNPVAPTFWSPGVSVLRVGAGTLTAPDKDYFYPANGNTLAINVWDMHGPLQSPIPSQITNAFIQVTTFYVSSGGNVYVTPQSVFGYYCWGPWNAGSATPITSSPNCLSLSQGTGSTAPIIWVGYSQAPGNIGKGNHYVTEPNTSQQMNMGCLATLQFQSPIQTPSSPLCIQIAVFLTLTPQGGSPVYVWDDPEMEVDCP